MPDLDVARSIAQVVFLACLVAGGYQFPILLTERRFRRGTARLGESFPQALHRARRWRWLTAPLALLTGLVLIGMTA